MFSFNKKKQEPKLGSITSFNHVTDHQKLSILNFLYLIAKSDGDVNGLENQCLNNYSTMLGTDFAKSFQYLQTGGINAMQDDLKNLSKEELEHLVIATMDVVFSDGNINETESKRLCFAFENIDVSEVELIKMIQKVTLFSNLF